MHGKVEWITKESLMPTMLAHKALYAAFDRFPSSKGAAIHIHRMANTLFEFMNGGLLYVLGDEALPPYQREGLVEILRFTHHVPNFLDRTLEYGKKLSDLLVQQEGSLQICQFRDPWSGVPILMNSRRRYKTIYEINGLPSLELPFFILN
jgi:hypothetical protein